MVVVVILLGVVIFLVLRALIVQGSRRGLMASGLEAQGIVLSASRFANSTSTINGQRYETRDITVDVEIPGRAPYVVSLSPLIPRICDVFPGSRLDLRVDRGNPSKLTVVGPAGSSGWMSELPALFPQGLGPVAASSGNGTVGLVILLLVLGGLETCSIASLVGQGSHAESSEPPPKQKSIAAAAPAPPPQKSSSSRSRSGPGPTCISAMSCCYVVGGSDCDSLMKMSESDCASSLDMERKKASRMKKTCP
jgi:hypothetical protein